MEKNEKNESILYIVYALLCVALIPLSKIMIVFKPLYDTVYYGTLNSVFFVILRAIVLVIGIFIIGCIVKKKHNFRVLINENTKREELPIKRLWTLFTISFGFVIFVSFLCGWQLKVLYDLGTKFAGEELTAKIANVALGIPIIVLAVMAMRLSQEGLEKLVNCKKPIPWGGLFLLLTFGVYDLLFVQESFKWLFLAANLLYGCIYLLTHKSVWKTVWIVYALYIL